jgi:tetratricopeptide (TPR) repeat protein
MLLLFTLGAAEGRKSKVDRRKETATNDPVYIEYLKLLAEDDAAEKEVDRWIQEAEEFAKAGDTTYKATVPGKAQQRFMRVKEMYKSFLDKHPNHIEARLAYGSFLMDIQDEEEGAKQWEKARELDPKNPAPWNNLANHYGHRGPVKKAFEYYAKAMELEPDEPVYSWNFATTVYLFRKDAREFYNINEQQVFDKAMKLYDHALRLDPTNILIATDLAQSYYGIKPMRTNDALNAWTNALALATTPLEKQGIYLHLARVELNTGHFQESRNHLNMVTNADMMDLKKRLEKNLSEKQSKASTNSVQLK